MKLNLTSELKAFSKPLLFFLVLIFLSMIVINQGISRISDIQAKLTEAKKNETILIQKQNLLTNLQNQINKSVDVSIAALPSRNPALMILNQLKMLSLKNVVLLSNFKVGTEVKEGDISLIELSFDVDGETNSILEFIKGIKDLLPLSLVDEVKISPQGTGARANVKTKVYFSVLPSKIPAITDPASDLTAAENDTISKLQNMTMPIFVEVNSTGRGVRTDPFGQ